MSKPRNPNANNAMATARVSDVTKAELQALVAKSGKTLSEITRWVIREGLPVVKQKVNQEQK
jgi:hypothetical protein